MRPRSALVAALLLLGCDAFVPTDAHPPHSFDARPPTDVSGTYVGHDGIGEIHFTVVADAEGYAVSGTHATEIIWGSGVLVGPVFGRADVTRYDGIDTVRVRLSMEGPDLPYGTITFGIPHGSEGGRYEAAFDHRPAVTFIRRLYLHHTP